MRRLKVLCRWSNARHARRQRGSVLRAVERTQQLFFLSELCSALQQQHRLAAVHVHAAHAAIAFAKTERDSGERAADEHEQKEQGCESDLHLYSGTLMKTTNKSQRFKSSGGPISRTFRQSLCPRIHPLIRAITGSILRKSTLAREQILGH